MTASAALLAGLTTSAEALLFNQQPVGQSEALRPAKAKGKGAEMEEYLFSNQEKFTPTWIKDATKRVAGVTDFDAEYSKVLEQVKADAALGRQLDVQATPTFFINGLKINGGFRPVFFEAVIEHELKKGSAS